MPQRRLRNARPMRNAIGASALMPLVDRLVAGGPAVVACLLAWLWTKGVNNQRTERHTYIRVAPSSDLSADVLSILRRNGLIRESFPPLTRHARGGFNASASAGELIGELADPEEAQHVAVVALTRLQEESNFPDQACALWRTLAAAEIVGFLEGELEDHYLDVGWARAIDPVITDELDHLSVSRGFYFSWMAMRDLASAYLRFPHLRDRLPQTLSGAFESKIRRAKNDGWVVRDFRRHARHPESALAAVYSRVMTRLDEDYLRLPPSREHLRLL